MQPASNINRLLAEAADADRVQTEIARFKKEVLRKIRSADAAKRAADPIGGGSGSARRRRPSEAGNGNC